MSESPRNTPASEVLSKSITDAINPDDIRAALIAEAEKQASDKAATDAAAKVAADKEVADKAAAAAAAKEPELFTRTVTIGGRDFTFEGETELELERNVNTALTVAATLQQDAPKEVTVDPEVDAAAVAKAAEERAAAQVELELKFKRGEINANEYIEQSGAIKDYLEKQGIPLDELKATVEAGRNKGFEQSWAEATESFLHSAAGADWPGGDQNRELIGMKIAALNLVDAEDKTAALAQAWSAMKTSRMYFPADVSATQDTPEQKAAAEKVTADAKAAEAALVATRKTEPTVTVKTAPAASSIFGASSGTGGAGSAEAAVKTKVEISKDATPAEILAAWKEGQVRDGKDPNAAFVEQFSSRRA